MTMMIPVSVLEHIGHALNQPGGQKEGARALQILAFRCLGNYVSDSAEFHISYLSAGRSGASVCRLDVRGGGKSQAFVLKFGPSRRALQRELIANREAGQVLEQPTLMAIIGELGTHECGYHAIAARIANRAVSLREWLVGEATIVQSEAVAEIVLKEQLEPFYREESRLEVATADWIPLSPAQRVRTRATVERYRGALSDPRAGGRSDSAELIERLIRFIDAGELELETRTRLEKNGVHVKVFGDLHSENILVQPGVNPRPVLIDASLYDRGHWSSDNARLLVDLLLRVRRPGVESMLWTSLSGAQENVLLLSPAL